VPPRVAVPPGALDGGPGDRGHRRAESPPRSRRLRGTRCGPVARRSHGGADKPRPGRARARLQHGLPPGCPARDRWVQPRLHLCR
jgi:hypothetical protein